MTQNTTTNNTTCMQVYLYAGKVYTYEEVITLNNRQLRYRILHKDRVKQKDTNYYKNNKSKINEYNRNNRKFKHTFKELCMIDIA